MGERCVNSGCRYSFKIQHAKVMNTR